MSDATPSSSATGSTKPTKAKRQTKDKDPNAAKVKKPRAKRAAAPKKDKEKRDGKEKEKEKEKDGEKTKPKAKKKDKDALALSASGGTGKDKDKAKKDKKDRKGSLTSSSSAAKPPGLAKSSKGTKKAPKKATSKKNSKRLNKSGNESSAPSSPAFARTPVITPPHHTPDVSSSSASSTSKSGAGGAGGRDQSGLRGNGSGGKQNRASTSKPHPTSPPRLYRLRREGGAAPLPTPSQPQLAPGLSSSARNLLLRLECGPSVPHAQESAFPVTNVAMATVKKESQRHIPIAVFLGSSLAPMEDISSRDQYSHLVSSLRPGDHETSALDGRTTQSSICFADHLYEIKDSRTDHDEFRDTGDAVFVVPSNKKRCIKLSKGYDDEGEIVSSHPANNKKNCSPMVLSIPSESASRKRQLSTLYTSSPVALTSQLLSKKRKRETESLMEREMEQMKEEGYVFSTTRPTHLDSNSLILVCSLTDSERSVPVLPNLMLHVHDTYPSCSPGCSLAKADQTKSLHQTLWRKFLDGLLLLCPAPYRITSILRLWRELVLQHFPVS